MGFAPIYGGLSQFNVLDGGVLQQKMKIPANFCAFSFFSRLKNVQKVVLRLFFSNVKARYQISIKMQ